MDQGYYPVISKGNVFPLTYISITAWHVKTCGQVNLSQPVSKDFKTEVSIWLLQQFEVMSIGLPSVQLCSSCQESTVSTNISLKEKM